MSFSSAMAGALRSRHRGQNDRALDRLFPIRADTQESERRTDGAQQDHAEHGSEDGALSAGDRRPPTTTAAITFISRPSPALLGI